MILYDPIHNTGDGLRTALYVLRAYYDAHSTSLFALANCIQKTPQVIASAFVEEKPDLKGIRELNKIRGQIRDTMPNLKRMDLRYSGTEPLFRVMLEGDRSISDTQLADAAWGMCRSVQNASGIVNSNNCSVEILNVSHGGLLYPHDNGRN